MAPRYLNQLTILHLFVFSFFLEGVHNCVDCFYSFPFLLSIDGKWITFFLKKLYVVLEDYFQFFNLINYAMFTCSSVSFSVCSGIPTATTLLLAPVTKQFDCGMCRAGNVFGFSLVIEVWFCLWQCPLMVAIWHLVMKMAQSWCGTSLVALVSHL